MPLGKCYQEFNSILFMILAFSHQPARDGMILNNIYHTLNLVNLLGLGS